jgi:hypothetical protein
MRRTHLLLLILLAGMILVGGCGKPNVGTALSARLSELSGKVDAKQSGEGAFAPASADTVLEVNGQVQTGDDGRVRLDLSSGTIIRVAPSTLFTLVSNEEASGGLATKLKLELGKLFIILNGGSAEVETPSGVASVRGSYMKVEVDPETGDVYVTCLEGICTASNPAGSITFGAGESVILYRRDPVTGNWIAPNAEPMTPEEFREWLDNNPEARELFEQAMATATAMAQPTESPEPTPTLQQAAPPADASSGCFGITEPAGGSNLPQQGRVTFGWEEQPGAQSYTITFHDPNGTRITITTSSTNADFYIEVLPAGGTYEWSVTAFGADGSAICTTESSSFSKPQGEPTPKPPKEPDTEPPGDPPSTCDPCDEGGDCYDPENEACFCDVCNEASSCYDPMECEFPPEQ